MPKGELCYQINHPEQETPCFVDVARTPCSNDDCPVYEAIRNSQMIRSFSPIDRELYIECNLLHFTCRMSRDSKDNAEFWEVLNTLTK